MTGARSPFPASVRSAGPSKSVRSSIGSSWSRPLQSPRPRSERPLRRRSPVDRKKDAWEGRLSTRRTFVGQLLNSVRRIRGHLAGWDDLAGSAGGGMNSMLEDVLAREGSAPAFEDSRVDRSEEHTSELQSLTNLVCRLLLEKKKKTTS